MERRQLLTMLVVFYSVLLFTNCAHFARADRVDYAFDRDYQHLRLVLELPLGAIEEFHHKDEHGYLTRSFRYEDGATFYVACRDLANNPVLLLDRSAGNLLVMPTILGQPGSGTYSNGTKWSRRMRDGFMFGYDYVDPKRQGSFDRAIQSARIKH